MLTGLKQLDEVTAAKSRANNSLLNEVIEGGFGARPMKLADEADGDELVRWCRSDGRQLGRKAA